MKKPEHNKANVLIVDDDAINIFLTREMLKNHCNLTAVLSGYEALKTLDKNIYDVILMDINLGDEYMDGLRTMRLIRQNWDHRYTRIFAVTAYSDARDWYVKQGFDDLFMKPVEKDKLIFEINKIITSELWPSKFVI